MNKSPNRLAVGLVVIITFSVLIVLAIALEQQVTTANYATVHLKVAPADSTVTIDGKASAAGDIKLPAGPHTITVSRADFDSKNVNLTLTSKQDLSEAVGLNPSGQAGLSYLQTHPDQAALREGIAGADAKKVGMQVEANNPITTILPYTGANYKVDFGISPTHKDDPNSIAVYVITDTPAGRTNALNWIKAQGYDPSGYEIIYQTSAQAQ